MSVFPKRRIAQSLLLATIAGCTPPLFAGETILQYFESQWETIERRMPDVFTAGYDDIWVPPPGRADSGGFSVGYDVFDRFDLGSPSNRTLYGTEQSFDRLSEEMNRAGLGLHIDSVLNHNGFSTADREGFEENGGYPGFVTRLSEDVDGDFHGAFEGGDLNGRLAGLIDIAQEKNHQFIRQPVDPDNPANIPNEVPRFSNRQYYTDSDPLSPAEFGDTSGDRKSPSGFNLDNPLAGDPVSENAKDLLYRYVRYMVEVKGVDGYRLDATKHIPTWFFATSGSLDYDDALFNIGRNPIDDSPFTPFSYGENFTGDFSALAAYVRKDGYGNRDTLDFPLYFTMDSVFGAGGFGNMRNLEFASFDGWDGNVNDGAANDGTYGVMFAGSHDKFGAGSFTGLNNVANAHVLTRTGFPLVYYNPQEFGTGRDFPKGGRGDAIGNFGATITTLVGINDEYIRGPHYTRWIDDDIYIYERGNAALVGLTDRGDAGFDERNVATAFAPGTVLVELTGNATNPLVDPSDEIFDTVTVAGDGSATIRVPHNASTAGSHGLGYVVYGPRVPASTLSIANKTTTIGPDPDDGRLEAVRRLTPLDVVTADTIEVTLSIEGRAVVPNDNALIKVNFGELDIDGDGNRNATGAFAGFEEFPVRPANGMEDDRVYTASIDATGLQEGYTYLETAAFLARSPDSPELFDIQRKVVYLDRLPPEQDLLFPPRTGIADITSADYEAVVSVDHTVNSVNILVNVPQGLSDEEILALASADNQARKHDRLEYRRVLNNLTEGITELTVIAYEETGNYSIMRYGNIEVDIPLPEIALGADFNLDSCCVDFQGIPATTTDAAIDQEFVIRVKTQDFDGLGGNLAFPDDFSVSIQIDDGPVIAAVPYSATLLPPVGRLVQNDQGFGSDDFDEFRFLWRGYSSGSHTIRAVTRLADLSEPANEALAQIEVLASAAGPSITITKPAPPGETVSNPDVIEVAGIFNDNLAANARIFLDADEAQTQLANIDNPVPGAFSVSRLVDSYGKRDKLTPGALSLLNGTFPVRVVASTGPGGSGIVSETGSVYTVTGIPALPTLTPLEIDGVANDTLGLPTLAVSAADGDSGAEVPADFGADGTLTELHAGIRDGRLYIALRGDMFGATNENDDNVSLVLIDVNGTAADGVFNIADQLSDTSDGLRSDISNARFALSTDLVNAGVGFDMAVGITSPNIGYGYSFGSAGLPGATDLFEFMPGVTVAHDPGAGAIAGASGTTIDAPDAFEISIPLSALGNPAIGDIRIVAVSASDDGFPSPNMLPENASDAFDDTQIIEDAISLPVSPAVIINEVFTGAGDTVELYNPGIEAVDVSGWALRIGDSDNVMVDYVFPSSTVLAPGVYTTVSDAPGHDLLTGFNIPWHEERGGSVALVDRFGVGIDYVTWRSLSDSPSTDMPEAPYGTGWSGTIVGAASTGAGQSIGRNSTEADSDAGSDWENTGGVDAVGPTLGAKNTGGKPLVIREVWEIR